MAKAACVAALLGLVEGARVARKASCGQKGASSRNLSHIMIVNGDDASPCEWKWQVGLKSARTGMPFCGGMLISDEWVLTAAHCASEPNFYVAAGDYKPRESSGYEQVRAAVQVIQHPDYTEGPPRWDLAMVKLESPVKFGTCVGTVCLPEKDVSPGTACWITGWGTLSSGGSQPGTLQEAQVDIISNSDCVNKYSYTSNDIDNSMICAQGVSGGTIRDACQGDSGGPLVCQSGGTWFLHGATSWGYGCAGKNYPGIWADVYEGKSWINSVMSGQYTPPAPSSRRRRNWW